VAKELGWDDEYPAIDPVAAKARQYQSVQSQIANLEIQAKGLSYEIAREFPAGPGTHTKTFGDVNVTLTRSERWSWDKSTIRNILLVADPDAPLTKEINRAVIDSAAIHKKVFEKLSAAAQKMLRAALTVKDGPFKIEVEDKEPT
jgi:hypothetical protein